MWNLCLFLIFNLIPLWFKKIPCIIPMLLHLLTLALWPSVHPSICQVFCNDHMQCFVNVTYVMLVGCIDQIFYSLPDLLSTSFTVKQMLKLPAKIVNLSIFYVSQNLLKYIFAFNLSLALENYYFMFLRDYISGCG